ncbi:hypothetical protein AMELA_G00185470, partial [Ameiurus melas]
MACTPAALERNCCLPKITTALFIREAEWMFSKPIRSPTASRISSTCSPFAGTHLTPWRRDSVPPSASASRTPSPTLNFHQPLINQQLEKQTKLEKNFWQNAKPLASSTNHAHSSSTVHADRYR